ncbi:carbohydrate kinase [Nesterenkonia sp. YGD6]|uniref:FGGY-family carbohydrate kinase n=1 Tax=Nesterenkonia sp. YGD6 TaxID=2901231 RepID=UPI001F4CF6EA|nr:FGGY-family carbohydrate kinase [Nesterenkonia sp. YGD6]MCH8562885.1 carbohydrate kinase [Nesterenkonia sp. YGD6]
MTSQRCFIGIDVGLTQAKAAAFDENGLEVRAFSGSNPRIAVTGEQQEIDMNALTGVVFRVLRQLTDWLAANQWTPAAVGVTAAGNGIYLVDEQLRPVRSAIASNDCRAEPIVAQIPRQTVDEMQRMTGSVPWAGQPVVLLRWLWEHERVNVERARWLFSCKDFISSLLTGLAVADVSDASAMGIMNLAAHDYEPGVFDMLGLPRELMRLLPPPAASDSVAGPVTNEAGVLTGLPVGIPVVAGCMDCVASPLGAGATDEGDVTIIVGTWAINSVVVPVSEKPPAVTLNALLPDKRFMLAQEVAPTSAASIEWFASLMSGPCKESVSPQALLAAASDVPAGALGALFIPFIHGAPEHIGASGTFLGLKGCHGYPEMARAVAEGIAQYHRVQLKKLCMSGASVSDDPWTLAGGGAKNALWAQMFADIIGHPVRRQLGTELGARGVASLAASGAGSDISAWRVDPDPKLVVEPSADSEMYRRQGDRFDRALDAMSSVWTELA